MYFLDSTGFFSLVSLVIQCILAWVFAAFFGLLSPHHSVWLTRWRGAFLGLGLALLAVSVRYLMTFSNLTETRVAGEGSLFPRGLYAVYLAGKVAFLWFLVGGLAALRHGAWPRCSKWAIATGLLVAGVAGASLPTVECILLVQAPLAAAAFAHGCWLLRRRQGERWEVGQRVVAGVLVVWCCVWILYAVCIAMVGPLDPETDGAWIIPLQLNALIDLTLQVILAAGLIVVVLQDAQRATVAAIEERDLLREQVQRDEKLRALSTLVGGVAHEINNPLTAILGYADDLSHESADVRNEAARVVREQSERCRQIVRRLSVLGRRPDLVRTAMDVETLVMRVARGFQPQLTQAGMDLAFEFDRGKRILNADITAVEQILTNLIANALQASPRGGRIGIRTTTGPDRLLIAVADQGPGVPEPVRARIFEPFWTTKQPGQGTGLGLAVARSLAEAHGGTLRVENAIDGGASFVLELPWGESDEPEPGPLVPRLAPASAPSAWRMLVVDDEEIVRTTIARRARSDGWEVTAVSSAEAALQIVLAPGARFDAVVCDLRMPGMSGATFHDRLAEQAPDLLRRTVFVTGDLASADAMAFAARCQAPVLVKPFSFVELFARLREFGQVV